MYLDIKNFSGIYKITNLINGKIYIGSAISFSARFHTHKSYLKHNKHCNKHLQRAWNKYREENFSFEILKICEELELISCEQWFIDNLKPEYNLSPTAGSSLGIKQTQEDKDKKRASNIATYDKLYDIDMNLILSFIKDRLSNKEITEKLGYKNQVRICKILKRRGVKNPNKYVDKYKKERDKNGKFIN